jgi:hypothetical protein
MTISIIFFIWFCVHVYFAAQANAAMDTVVHHFSKSTFKLKNDDQWYDASISWRNKYVNGNPADGKKRVRYYGIYFWQPDVFSDAWHFFKFRMLVHFWLGVIGVLFVGIFLPKQTTIYIISSLLVPTAMCVIWLFTFNYWYNKGFIA